MSASIGIDWLAIFAAVLFSRSASKIAWCGLLLMSYLFSAFSLATPWSFFLPMAFGIFIFIALRKNFVWTPVFSRAILLFLLIASTWGFALLSFFWRGAGFLLDRADFLSALLTFVVGAVLLPALAYFGKLGLRRCLAWAGLLRTVDLSRADWLSVRETRVQRKPFGLEKGL